MPKHAFILLQPACRTSAVVFASPHSGCDYPEWFVRRSLLNAHSIRSSEDAFVDKLFEMATDHGAPFLMAGAPRAFLDLNRSVDELDPALIKGVRKVGHNPRVASGLGVIPRVVANGRPIYRGKLTLEEANRRIDSYWRPYHARLQELLNDSIQMYGRAILVDCHSMPNEALDGIAQSGRPRPDIVLGDRFGASCEPDIVDEVEQAFTDAGLRVARNTPFAGAYVTQNYGRPSRKQHAIQIEVNRSLYMDEHTIQPRAEFEAFRGLLSDVIGKISQIGRPASQPLAAE
ncbi:N-formylglutamate amidohydrolase [Shimia sp. SDUM112013]|uniref:N-formylglutamate amidohydrolase n=1 Tax=Shimia sp. SDUM112013 TaxID=3136160 RepID=UPI0032ED4251